jgi:DNA-binding NarL/FixJ family response regulator
VSIRVVLADDHPVVRTGIRHILERAPDIDVIQEVSDGISALRLAEELVPDVLLLDMELTGLSGVEVARRLQAAGSPVRVLALSAYDDEQYIFGLLASGAAGYLIKDEALDTIVDAVRGVAQGEEGWLSRRVAAKVMRQKVARSINSTDLLAYLSAREREVLQYVALGYTNDQIAETLCLSDGTVKNHVSNIYNKLGVRTRAEAVALAWKQGLVSNSGDTPS